MRITISNKKTLDVLLSSSEIYHTLMALADALKRLLMHEHSNALIWHGHIGLICNITYVMINRP